MEFKIREENGVKIITPIIERIEKEDGTVDVIIHAPSLDLINKQER